MKDFLDNLKEFKDLKGYNDLKQYLSERTLQELIENWHLFDQEMADMVFRNLDTETQVSLITELSIEDQERIIISLSQDAVKVLTGEMEPDDLVDIIQAVSPEVREAVWSSLSDNVKQETEFLLRFDEDDAAGLMTPRFTAVRSDIDVKQALAFIRKNIQNVETIYYIYVVDKMKRLTGVFSLRELLSKHDDEKIESFIEKQVIQVKEDTDQEEVAKILEKNDLLAIPVVDNYNRILGIVTIDDIIDVIREEQTEDIYKMGAMGGDTDSYLGSSLMQLFKKRIPWLIILLLAGTITANVIQTFEAMIASTGFLYLFMTVITQTGGNCGTQSSTLMIRGLATGEIHFKDIGKVILKEIVIGILMGLVTGLLIILRSYYMPPGIDFMQAIAVGSSLSLVVLFSTVLGALVPLLIHRLGFDPTVAAGPLMATVIDVCGLTIYFKTAQLILGV